MSTSEMFFSKLRWIVERKDFEDFWPVGLETTGTRYWSQLVLDLDAVRQTGNLATPDYPTANVALVFCLIYGMRELGWSPSQSAELIEELFKSAQKCKSGNLLNTDGMNLIWDNDTATKKFEAGTQLLNQNVSVQDVHELSGIILALAESEYFMNHRIGTEKHGPYLSTDGNLFMVRSFKNLRPIDLWPQLYTTKLSNEEFHLVFKYRIHEVSFDVLSNQLSSLPSNDSLLAVALIGGDGFDDRLGLIQIEEFVKAARQGIRIIGDSLAKMEQWQKAERLTEILYFGCRNSLCAWKEMASIAIKIGGDRSVRFPVPRYGKERFAYYDLTQSFH